MDRRSIRICETATGNTVQTLSGNLDLVMSIAFHPDARHLVSLDKSGEIRVWDWSAGVCTLEFSAASLATHVAYSPDGKFIVGYGGPEVGLWNSDTGDLVHRLVSKMHVNSIAFTPDGKRLLVGGVGVAMWKLSDDVLSPRFVLTNNGWASD